MPIRHLSQCFPTRKVLTSLSSPLLMSLLLSIHYLLLFFASCLFLFHNVVNNDVLITGKEIKQEGHIRFSLKAKWDCRFGRQSVSMNASFYYDSFWCAYWPGILDDNNSEFMAMSVFIFFKWILLVTTPMYSYMKKSRDCSYDFLLCHTLHNCRLCRGININMVKKTFYVF